jgi:hypothetical protein
MQLFLNHYGSVRQVGVIYASFLMVEGTMRTIKNWRYNTMNNKLLLNILAIIFLLLIFLNGTATAQTCTRNDDCDDNNPCTFDVCKSFPSVCVHTPVANNIDCRDNIYCNGTIDYCQDGVCIHSGNPCSEGTICNETTKTCDPIVSSTTTTVQPITTTSVAPTTTSSVSTTTIQSTTTTIACFPEICCATKVMGEGNNNLNTLRAFRNRILIKTIVGYNYVYLYNKHSQELTDIFMQDEELQQRANMLIIRLMPAVISLLATGKTSMSEELVQGSIELIDELKAQASPALEKDLSRLMMDIHSGVILNTFNVGIKN